MSEETSDQKVPTKGLPYTTYAALQGGGGAYQKRKIEEGGCVSLNVTEGDKKIRKQYQYKRRASLELRRYICNLKKLI